MRQLARMTQFIAQTPDDLPDREKTLSMSGLEFLREMLAGRISGPPIAGLMNFWLVSVDDGRAVFRGVPKFECLNPMGTVHGGWHGALLDSCLGCAVLTRLPRGASYTTLEYKVNITRSIPLGMEMIATGVSQHSGRSTGVASGEIRGAQDGKLYATGSTTCIIFPPEKP